MMIGYIDHGKGLISMEGSYVLFFCSGLDCDWIVQTLLILSNVKRMSVI